MCRLQTVCHVDCNWKYTNLNHSNTFNNKICRSSSKPLYRLVFLRMLLSLFLFLYMKFGRNNDTLTSWLGFRKMAQGVLRQKGSIEWFPSCPKWSISYMLSWLDLDLPGTCVAAEVILPHFRVRPLKCVVVSSLCLNLEVSGQISELTGHVNWWQGCWEKSMQKWNKGCIQISSQTMLSFVVCMKAYFIGMKPHYG